MSYATTGDLQARWRTLTSEEQSKADLILADVERDIRREFPDIDVRLATDSDLALEVTRITCNVARRRMANEDVENLEQISETSGPFGRSRTFRAAADGTFDLTAQERRILAGMSTSAGSGSGLPLWSNEP